MEKYGVDFCLDVHGDEEIPHVFTAGCEGNPGYTPRIAELEERFRSDLKHQTKDFQTTYGSTPTTRSEEHTSALQSLMRISSAVFYMIKKQHEMQETCLPQIEKTLNQYRNTQATSRHI